MKNYIITRPGYCDRIIRANASSPFSFYYNIPGQTKLYRSLTVITDVTNGNHSTPNAHAFRTERLQSIQGVRIVTDSTGYYESLTGDIASSSGSKYNVPDLSTYMYNMVLSDLNEKVRGSLDLSIDIAEAGKTRRMIRDAFKVVDFARQLRKQVGVKVADVWLQYQYGWRPLVNSIYGVLDEITSKGLSRQLLVKIESTRRFDHSISTGLSYPLPGINKVNTSYRVKMSVRLKNGALSSGIANYTSLNPASIAWELLPYSFVIDWFYNVGGYLRNLETAMIYGNAFHSGYWTYGYLSNQNIICTGRAQGSTSTTYSGYGKCRIAYKSRVPLASYPMPRRPVLNTYSLGSSRLLSAAALLAQFLRK